MLRSIVATAGAVLLMSAAAARPARAMTDREEVKAHVPFAFQVEGRQLPAGDYEFYVPDANHPEIIEIRGTHPSESPIVAVGIPAENGSVNNAKMVFDDVGSQKFLRSIELPGQEGVEFLAHNAELRATHELAAEASPTPSAGTR